MFKPFQASKLPPTTPKKRKPSTTGKNPKVGESSPIASKKKQKKDVSKDTNVSGLDSRDVAPSQKSTFDLQRNVGTHR